MPHFIARTGQKVEMVIMDSEVEITVYNAKGDVISTTRANRMDAAELMIGLSEVREA
jgi:hypothetical protein